jgi:ribosome-binding protein aMBF1 (putative translation factor)
MHIRKNISPGASYHNKLFKKSIQLGGLYFNPVEKHKDIKKIFGANLRRFRVEKRLSQRALDALCNIDHAMISRMENGGVNVTLNTLRILADALGVHPYLLVKEEEQFRHYSIEEL